MTRYGLFGSIVMILIMFIGAATGQGIIAILLCVSVTAWLSQKIKYKSVDIPIICVLLLVFQNLCIGLGAHLTGNTKQLSLITQIPFLVMLLVFMVWFVDKYGFGRIVINKSNKYFILLCVILCIYFFIGNGVIAKLVYLRNMIMFYVTYIIGREYINSPEKKTRYLNMFLTIIVIVVFLGVILELCDYEVWKAIGIHEVYIAKMCPFFEPKIPDRFYTVLIKKAFLRMGSIYYEPVNLAYLMAAGVIACYLNKWNNNAIKTVVLMICVLGLILTVGKGGYLLISLIVFAQIFYKFVSMFTKKKHEKYKLILGSVVIFLCVFLLAKTYIKYTGGGLALPHFLGIMSTFKAILKNPLGNGLGSGGNMAAIENSMSYEEWLSGGGETGVLNFAYQIGILGLIVYIMCYIQISKDTNYRFKEKKEYILGKTLPLCILIVGLFQENTFTPQCISALMFLQGMMSANGERV